VAGCGIQLPHRSFNLYGQNNIDFILQKQGLRLAQGWQDSPGRRGPGIFHPQGGGRARWFSLLADQFIFVADAIQLCRDTAQGGRGGWGAGGNIRFQKHGQRDSIARPHISPIYRIFGNLTKEKAHHQWEPGGPHGPSWRLRRARANFHDVGAARRGGRETRYEWGK